ncbi:hypothetical protein UK23_14820 [Lentzea aerocolonigenes]|uniref:Uncharacterized protein n=1 Tax=Lentzea aerocolonigenes TaxID=68170 RepID=A0A0F0H4J8_LENAE|nr:hypothetical protein [Lentzea aerocolonigenes]KJK49242.1 hypothetical protein UK23_14820 [Lentzea aerocolonigenes]
MTDDLSGLGRDRTPVRTALESALGAADRVSAVDEQAALLRAVHLMHQPAIAVRNTSPDDLRGVYSIVDHNEEAALHLRCSPAELASQPLSLLLAADTARAVSALADRAMRAGGRVTAEVFAPDPLADLIGGPVVSVRATPAGGLVLVSWFAGHEQYRRAGSEATVGDRLAVADALDLVADAGIGLFTMDLVTGDVVWTDGMYELFGVARVGERAPNLDAVLALTTVETAELGLAAWLELVHHGTPMNVRFQFRPASSGRWVRLVARASTGADGFPQRVSGICMGD